MPGPLGMNDLVVVQTAQGLLEYCRKELGSETPRFVIGYDHRENTHLGLSSKSFAIATALVFRQAGADCVLLDGYVHTPLVAFSTTALKAAAGIMVTASHNPKEDAGYKVYWSDGCQIRPPIDKGIASSISENLTPWHDYASLLLLSSSSSSEQQDQDQQKDSTQDDCFGLSSPDMTKRMEEEYFLAIQQSGLIQSVDVSTSPKFVYTAMHGVGYPYAKRVFDLFGLPPFESVPSQEQPDAAFPTVSFPNPEEDGALDAAKALAEKTHDGQNVIVFANDPDADRLAVAEYDCTQDEWTTFTGDQIGVLLGHWLWERIGKDSDKVSTTVLSHFWWPNGRGLFFFQGSSVPYQSTLLLTTPNQCIFVSYVGSSTARCNVCIDRFDENACQDCLDRRLSL